MAWTADQITALETAISRGVLSVTLANETITYHSLEQMRLLLADMRREVAATTTGQPYRLAATSKGI